jgi:hypothetical protein
MKVNRRTTMRILAGASVGPGIAAAQAPTTNSATNPDAELASARESLRNAAQRIAKVELKRFAEPAFRFRAY